MGGALRITDLNHQNIDVLPLAGRIAMFYSSEIAHEVLPCYNERYAITIWYYDTLERMNAINEAKLKNINNPNFQNSKNTKIESQIEAKQFISELMGGNEIDSEGGDPTIEDISLLALKVRNLSEEAVTIVSSITGAPSPESFKEGFELLQPNDLKSMRKLFRNMGLN